MRTSVFLLVGALVGCGGASVNIPDGGGDGGTDGQGPADGQSGTDGQSGACGAAAVPLSFGNCPPAPTCGGTIADGVYVYTAGCVPDPWAQAKMYCKTLQVSGEQGSVRGCLTFSGPSVSRDVTATYSAKLDYPTACLLGGSCMQLESTLKPYFAQVSCATAVSGCSCSVQTTTSSTATVGYSVQGNQVVTSTNGHYDYCVTGNTLGMRYVSGPNPEPGIYQLAKK